VPGLFVDPGLQSVHKAVRIANPKMFQFMMDEKSPQEFLANAAFSFGGDGSLERLNR